MEFIAGEINGGARIGGTSVSREDVPTGPHGAFVSYLFGERALGSTPQWGFCF